MLHITIDEYRKSTPGHYHKRVRWSDGFRHGAKSRTFSTKSAAEAWALDYANEIKQLSGGNPVFLTYLREYVDQRKRSLTNKNSQAGWELAYKRATEFFTPKEKIRDVTPSRYKSFLYYIGRSFAQSSNKWVNYALKRAFEDAKVRKMIDHNPASGIRTSSITGRKMAENNPKHPINIQETHKIIDYLLTHTDHRGHVPLDKEKSYESGNYLIILTALLTGMREGEIAGLRWEDLDEQQHTIHITHQVDSGSGFTVEDFLKESRKFDKQMHGNRRAKLNAFDGLRIIKSPKTETSIRTIVAPKILFETLKRAKYDGEPEYSPIFKTRSYKIIGRSNLSYKLHAILDKLDIHSENYHFHNLRHTHVALLLYEGVSIATISERLGHGSIDMTLDRYAYEVEEMKKRDSGRIYNKLEDFANGKGQQKSKNN